MPWKIAKNDSGDKWCVHKEAPDGGIGEQVACHDSEAEAKQQMAALYSNEPAARAVKMVDGSEDMIEGLLLPYGGPFNGRDAYGEFFSAKTDFCRSWFPNELPLLYHHGLDSEMSVEVIGRIKSVDMRAGGGWMQAQLDKSAKYHAEIKKLIEAGALGLSSGAMGHLVQVDAKSGEILRWPLIEGSCTPTEANPFAKVSVTEAAKHFEMAGLKAVWDETESALKAKMAGSYEQLMDDLEDACNPRDPITGERTYGSYIVATFPDHCIVRRHEDSGNTFWKVAYSLDEAGKPVMGESTQVEQTYVPVRPERPMAMMAWAVEIKAASLAERTKDLHQRRLKEGRMISDANRRRLMACMDQMSAAMREMQTLLDSSTPAPKGTEGRTANMESLRRLRAQLVAQHISALALN